MLIFDFYGYFINPVFSGTVLCIFSSAQFDEAVKLGERRGNKVVITTEIPGEGRHDPDGTIYLNPNANFEEAKKAVGGHELFEAEKAIFFILSAETRCGNGKKLL